MYNLIEYLRSKGYVSYRRVYKNKKWINDFDINISEGFTTTVSGGVDIRFVKDNDFDNVIIFGLHEHKKPPTLITPRPHIKMWRGNVFCEQLDDAMNHVLRVESSEDIFKAMFDKSIMFKYK